MSANDVEESIAGLHSLQEQREIHLIIATQRPFCRRYYRSDQGQYAQPRRFCGVSGVDSRTILDMVGAEKLLGKGDMLFYPQGYAKPVRVQGCFVSDDEVGNVVDFLKEQNPLFGNSNEVQEKIDRMASAGGSGTGSTSGASAGPEIDEYFVEAGRFIIEKDKASIGLLQRVFKIGFNRAARIMDQLCEAGVVGDEEGTKARKILMTKEQFEQYISEM